MCHHTQSQETACRLDSLQAVLEILCKAFSTGPGQDCDFMIQNLDLLKENTGYIYFKGLFRGCELWRDDWCFWPDVTLIFGLRGKANNHCMTNRHSTSLMD